MKSSLTAIVNAVLDHASHIITLLQHIPEHPLYREVSITHSQHNYHTINNVWDVMSSLHVR